MPPRSLTDLEQLYLKEIEKFALLGQEVQLQKDEKELKPKKRKCQELESQSVRGRPRKHTKAAISFEGSS